jgi:hypothetical protein
MITNDPLYPSPAHVQTMVAVCSTAATLATLFTGLRMFTKWRYINLMLDDLFMFGATVSRARGLLLMLELIVIPRLSFWCIASR